MVPPHTRWGPLLLAGAFIVAAIAILVGSATFYRPLFPAAVAVTILVGVVALWGVRPRFRPGTP